MNHPALLRRPVFHVTKIISIATFLGDDPVTDSSPCGKNRSRGEFQTLDQASGKLLEPLHGCVMTIGNFDGVHLGHARLLGEVRLQAEQLHVPSVAVVFDPHPAALLRPDRVPPRLTWLQLRAERLTPLGIDYLVVCETTRAFLQLSPEMFFQWLVLERLHASGVIEGPNFFFGRGRQGNIRKLEELCDESGVGFQIVGSTEIDGEMISSTRIRQAIAEGNIELATELLGTYHRIRGRVVQGDGRGRAIGFPTANLAQIDVASPGPGVYGGYAYVGHDRYPAAIHVGPRPTFDTSSKAKPESTVEIHVLDFVGDLYDQLLMVDVVTQVRDISRFESAQQLATQLGRDIEIIRTRLASSHPSRN